MSEIKYKVRDILKSQIRIHTRTIESFQLILVLFLFRVYFAESDRKDLGECQNEGIYTTRIIEKKSNDK